MSTNGDPQTSGTVIVAIVGAILVFVVIVALQALFYNVEQAELYNKVYTQAPEELTRLRAEQLERLNSYRWIDKKNGIAAIPIDRAMRLAVQELSASARPTEAAGKEVP